MTPPEDIDALVIETERLRLRPYAPEDLGTLHQLWTHPGVRRYLFDDEIMTRPWVRDEIRQTRRLFAEKGYGQWLAHWRDTGVLAGFGGYRAFFDPPILQIIYGVAPDFWGEGVATEMARAMMRYGFEHVGFDRIIACADTPNTASIRVMEKLGMRFDRHTEIDGDPVTFYFVDRPNFEQAAASAEIG